MVILALSFNVAIKLLAKYFRRIVCKLFLSFSIFSLVRSSFLSRPHNLTNFGFSLSIMISDSSGSSFSKTVAREFDSCSETVSYTHLRAHETDSYLVCRLLLEKKNTSVYGFLDLKNSINNKKSYGGTAISEIRKMISQASCLLYTSPSPRDGLLSRMPSSA